MVHVTKPIPALLNEDRSEQEALLDTAHAADPPGIVMARVVSEGTAIANDCLVQIAICNQLMPSQSMRNNAGLVELECLETVHTRHVPTMHHTLHASTPSIRTRRKNRKATL